MKTQECYFCKGTGYDDTRASECEFCFGTGTVSRLPNVHPRKAKKASLSDEYSFREPLPGCVGYVSKGGHVIYYGPRTPADKPGDLFWPELG